MCVLEGMESLLPSSLQPAVFPQSQAAVLARCVFPDMILEFLFLLKIFAISQTRACLTV